MKNFLLYGLMLFISLVSYAKPKSYCSLVVKQKLVANNLRVCNDAEFNNVVINGDFIACGKEICPILSPLISATSCDIPNTLVLRDENGSFSATTISLTGNPMINYNNTPCDPAQGFVFAPLNNNTFVGIASGNSGTAVGSDNTAYGYYAGAALTTGTNNIYIGSFAGANHQGNNSIFLGNTQAVNGDGLIYIGNPSTEPGSSTTTTIYGCINLPEVNFGSGYMATFDVASGQLLKVISSRRYKDNIEAVTSDVSDKVYTMEPAMFNFKNAPDTKSFGLIAEEAHKVCPEVVIYNENNEPESVNYLSLQILALAALIKQQKTIEELTDMVHKLQEQLAQS